MCAGRSACGGDIGQANANLEAGGERATAHLSTSDHLIALPCNARTLDGERDELFRRTSLAHGTDGLGADVALEAVGVPDTFELATELIRPGGRVANIGVHGKPAALHLEKLWTRDVTITTGLVDTNTIPQLMRLVASGRLDPSLFATHRLPLSDTMAAYDTFADAANTGALKIVLEGGESTHGSDVLVGAASAA